jgi:hypothetical protein
MQVYSDQLAQCQRYYETANFQNNYQNFATGFTYFITPSNFMVVKRTAPTMTFLNLVYFNTSGATVGYSPTSTFANTTGFWHANNVAVNAVSQTAGGNWYASAEL